MYSFQSLAHPIEFLLNLYESFLRFRISRHNIFVMQAIETVKTRMQVSGLGVGETASSLYAKEGVASFWKGLTFAWGREIFYTSIKLGGES
jgi:hypothetical protein